MRWTYPSVRWTYPDARWTCPTAGSTCPTARWACSNARLAWDETDVRLFPPVRADWAKRGEPVRVMLSGRNAPRVIFRAHEWRSALRLGLRLVADPSTVRAD